MGRAIFLFVLLIIALVFGVQIFWHMLGVMTVVAWAVTAVVFVIGMLYCLYLLMKAGIFGGGGGGGIKMPHGKPAFKVWNSKANSVYIFREEPSIKDLAMLTDELHLAKLELQGDVYSVANDSYVIVLEDDREKEAVKIRFKNIKKKDRDAVGWVCRSSLIREEKRIGQ